MSFVTNEPVSRSLKQTAAMSLVRAVLVLTILAAACADRERRTPAARDPDYSAIVLGFGNALASRDYAKAYAMTSSDYHRSTSLDAMRAAFESIVPTTWGTVGPVAVSQVMETWPAQQASDVGWANISIGGDLYSEGLTVVVMMESNTLKIRSVEFGRP